MVHTSLIVMTYLIADHDIDLFLDRDRLADRGFILDRLIAKAIDPMKITPSP